MEVGLLADIARSGIHLVRIGGWVVPSSEFSLKPGDQIAITVAGIGVFRNVVERLP